MVAKNELYWTAGFLDGEGSFTLCGKTPRVQATQVDVWHLEKLMAIFGGTISPKKPAGFGKQQCHSWALTGPRAVGLMMTMYDLISPRRQSQITRVLTFWKSCHAGVGTRHHASTVSDDDAFQAMKRVADGESVDGVARSFGVTRIALRKWLCGESRPYLMKRFLSSGQYWEPRKEPIVVSDEMAFCAMKRVQSGERIGVVAKSVGVSRSTVHYWMNGFRKPHLLEMLERKE